MTYTDLKLYCCTEGTQDHHAQWKNRHHLSRLPLEQASNVVESLNYCSDNAYKNLFGEWTLYEKNVKGFYTVSIEFDVSAPLLCPESFYGTKVWVDCVSRLCTLESTSVKEGVGICLDRNPVEGSLFLHVSGQNTESLSDDLYHEETKELYLKENPGGSFYVTYRPCLLMRVQSIDHCIKEDIGTSRWKISLSE